MSKQSTNRSKTEKSKGNANVIHIAQDVIPGKLSEQEWNLLLEDDLSEKICYEVVTEIVENTLDAAFKAYLKSQLIPFTVHQASLALLQLVDLEFMCCDLGEPHITTSAEWAEDEVASSSKIDSWAQGAISKTFHAKLLDRVISPTKHDEAKLCDSKIIKRKDIISDGKNKDDSGMNVDQRSIESIAKHDKPQKKVLNKDYNRKPIEQRTFTSRRIKSSIDDPQLISCKTEVLSEAEDISSKNKFIVDKQAGNTISKKRTKPIVKQISEAMLLSKRTSGSGKLIFDDEGNLISVPKLHPVNNKHSESTTAVGGYLEVNGSNPLGNKIPVQWRFLTNSLDSTTHHRFELTSTTKKFRTARSSMSTKTNKTRSRNRSFDSTEQTISPDLIRLQRIKNACGNVTNTIDLVDLVSGVTISDGEHLKIGRSTNEQFSSILNTNWDDLEEIPPVKVK